MNEIDIFYPTSQAAWRQWLVKYHLSKSAVWLVFYRKSSNKPSLTWSEAVDVALCFGWIDSKKVKIDNEASRQLFSRRKPQSTWSRSTKKKFSGSSLKDRWKQLDMRASKLPGKMAHGPYWMR